MTTPPATGNIIPADQDGAARVPSDTWTWRAAVRAAGCAQDASARMRLDMWTLQHLVGYATVDATSPEIASAMGVGDQQVEDTMRSLADKGLVTGRRTPWGIAWEPTPKGLAAAPPLDSAPSGLAATA